MKKLIIILAMFSMKASAQVQMDKISHIAVGGCIGGLTYSISTKLTESKWKPTAFAIGTAMVVSVGKELIDRKLYNSPLNESAKDIGYTLLGAGLACLTLKVSF